MSKSKLGATIRKARERAALSLRTVASRSKISPTYLSHIETGKVDSPSEDVLCTLARIVACDVDELMRLAGRIPRDIEALLIADASLVRALRRARDANITGAILLRCVLPSTK